MTLIGFRRVTAETGCEIQKVKNERNYSVDEWRAKEMILLFPPLRCLRRYVKLCECRTGDGGWNLEGARPMLNFKGIDGQWVTRLFKGGLATVMLQCLVGYFSLYLP